jgi:hypothetical protein
MEKIMLSIKFDFESLFPTKEPKKNGIIFTEEAIKKAMESINGSPFIIKKDDYYEMPIGYIQNYDSGFLWIECYPEITVKDIQEIDGIKIVNDFIFNAVKLK